MCSLPEEMDTSRLLFFIVMAISQSEGSELPCEDSDIDQYNLLEGEAFYVEPVTLDKMLSDHQVKWYKNNSHFEEISTDEKERVHYHGSALFFLKLQTEDSGSYIALHRNETSGECINYHITIKVLKEKEDKELLYGQIKNSDKNMMVPCPQQVAYMCDVLKGNITWEKDFEPLRGHHNTELWVNDVNKAHEGIYSCICSWTHNNKVYKSSSSRMLKTMETFVNMGLQILHPTSKEVFADEGFEIKLHCSVFCGIRIGHHCNASWKINGLPFNNTDRYSQKVVMGSSNTTISTAILTIKTVSAKDFQSKFTCNGKNTYNRTNKTITLKRRETIIPLAIGGVAVLLLCVFATVLLKCFAIDIVLLFRPCLSVRSCDRDMRIYDAFVVYQTQSLDKRTEDTLCEFISKVLPSVLEDKCGYRLFIHGRDDIPGEDCLKHVEACMQQSKRLMVILSPGSESVITDQPAASPQDSAFGGFLWQIGLYHALVQRNMGVILIQIGDTGPEGYKNLPPSLQHLILKSAPIRWREASRGAASWNSCFWKKVRYLMPAVPATKCTGSTATLSTVIQFDMQEI